MTYFPYNHELARAVAARFIQLEGCDINKMKLMKLMYMLDREAICEDGCAIVGGRYVALSNGEIVSENGYELQLYGKDFDFDLISEWVEEKILAVYQKFGRIAPFELSEYPQRQKNYQEWQKRTKHVTLRDIAGDKADEVEALAQELSMFIVG